MLKRTIYAAVVAAIFFGSISASPAPVKTPEAKRDEARAPAQQRRQR